jgi:hypothetical protein
MDHAVTKKCIVPLRTGFMQEIGQGLYDDPFGETVGNVGDEDDKNGFDCRADKCDTLKAKALVSEKRS